MSQVVSPMWTVLAFTPVPKGRAQIAVVADAPQTGADVLSAPNAAPDDASAGAVSWEEEGAGALEMCEVNGLAASIEALCGRTGGLKETKYCLPVVALNELPLLGTKATTIASPIAWIMY